MAVPLASATPSATGGPPAHQPTPVPGINLSQELKQLDATMPRLRSEAYRNPTEAERAAFGQMIGELKAGNLSSAREQARSLHYEVSMGADVGDHNAMIFLVREDQPIANGWGLYAYRIAASREILIEAPHPVTDEQSEYVALDVYRAVEGRALLVAGAHRDSKHDGTADVAHNPATIFEAVQEALVPPSSAVDRNSIILQIHGFATYKHEGYPAVVLGVGKQPSTAQLSLAKAIVEALVNHGVDAAVCHDETWEEVCGTSNVQLATSNGSVFIHMELNETVRSDDRGFVAALAEVFAK